MLTNLLLTSWLGFHWLNQEAYQTPYQVVHWSISIDGTWQPTYMTDNMLADPLFVFGAITQPPLQTLTLFSYFSLDPSSHCPLLSCTFYRSTGPDCSLTFETYFSPWYRWGDEGTLELNCTDLTDFHTYIFSVIFAPFHLTLGPEHTRLASAADP